MIITLTYISNYVSKHILPFNKPEFREPIELRAQNAVSISAAFSQRQNASDASHHKTPKASQAKSSKKNNSEGNHLQFVCLFSSAPFIRLCHLLLFELSIWAGRTLDLHLSCTNEFVSWHLCAREQSKQSLPRTRRRDGGLEKRKVWGKEKLLSLHHKHESDMHTKKLTYPPFILSR